jgi:chromosome segregation ATPase
MATETNEAEARIQQLITERNAARSDLQEARAEIASLTEAGTATKGATESAVAAARAEMQARITELEGNLRRTTNRSLLLADKIPEDGMDDLLEYLDYQYSKLEAGADGAKPEFSDWYKGARRDNKVLRAAMKPSVAAKAAEVEGEVETVEAAPAKAAPAARTAIPAKPNVVPVRPGDTGKEIDISKLKHGTAEYAAAKQRLKQIAFPSVRQ